MKMLLLLFLPVLLLSIAVASTTRQQRLGTRSISIKPAGDPINVWSSVDTWKRCGEFIDVPDIPPRLFRVSPESVRMICGSAVRDMVGPTVWNMTRTCRVAWNKTADPDPSLYASNEFLDSTHAFRNGTVVSLLHTEYPGNNYHKECPLGSYPHCWMVSVGLAISHDFGRTWKHAAEPPHHLVAALPYHYNASQLASGWGDPSSIIEHEGAYYVALWNRNTIEKQPEGICIARTHTLLDPKSWRGWNGSHYGAILSTSPYTNDTVDIDQHICQVTNLPAKCPVLSLSWSNYVHAFVAVLQCDDRPGFFYSTSHDLITWTTPPTLFYSKADLSPGTTKKQIVAMMYPALVDPSTDDPNFSRIGRSPWLFWTSLGHSPYTDGRHLWATPMEFTTSSSSSGSSNSSSWGEVKQ